MSRLPFFASLLLALCTLACQPEIGDECESSLNCPAGAICDSASPGGYCLITSCDENSDCPDEAVCIEFNEYTRYCMKECSSKDDCRDGYTCRDDFGTNRFCYVPAEEGEAPFTRAE